jgi:DNA-directed RNA polymerase subunit K/omega
MINRSPLANSFEFVIVAALRTQQLQRGCIQRVLGTHKFTTLAQMEIVAGKVERLPPVAPVQLPVE